MSTKQYRWRRLERGADWLAFDIGESLVYDGVVATFPDIERGVIEGTGIRWYWLPFDLCGRRRYHSLACPDGSLSLRPDLPLVLTGTLDRHPNADETGAIRGWLDEHEHVNGRGTVRHDTTPELETTSKTTTRLRRGLRHR